MAPNKETGKEALQAKKKPTIRDVAEAAGVSYQTVSRVLNNQGRVNIQTQKKVLKVVKEMNYQPNTAARDLSRGYSSLIGLIAFGMPEFGPAQVIDRIEAISASQGKNLLLAVYRNADTEHLLQAVKLMKSHNISGLLILSPFVHLDVDDLQEVCGDLPFVLLDSDPTLDLPTTAIDEVLGGRMAAEHVVSLGHTRIALLAGHKDYVSARLRHLGWIQVLSAYGLQAAATMRADWDPKSGYLATRKLLEEGVEFSALLSANDQMALGAIKALKEFNLRIPEDVAVVGYDNTTESEFYDPPLTTIQQDFDSLAVNALQQLSDVQQGQQGNTIRLVPPQLVIRKSTL